MINKPSLLEPSRWADAIASLRPELGRETEPFVGARTVGDTLRRLVATDECVADAGGGAESGDMLFARPVSDGGRQGALSDIEAREDRLQLAIGGIVLALDAPTMRFIRHADGLNHSIFLLTGRPANAQAHEWVSTHRIQLFEPQLMVAVSRPGSRGAVLAHTSLTFRSSPLTPVYLSHRFARPSAHGDAELEARRRYEADVRQQLKKAFGHLAAAEAPLAQEDLEELAWMALNLGVQPTVELVRDVVGRGSPNTLHPMLKTFWATLIDKRFEPVPPSDIPPGAVEMWKQVLDLARREAAARVAQERAALDDERERHRQAVEAFEQDIVARESAVAERKRTLQATEKASERHLADLRRQLEQTSHALQAAENKLASQARQIEEGRLERDRLVSELVGAQSAQRALAALEGEHRAVVSERDRLGRLLERLHPASAS